ncbi:MAG: hypothetical protein CVU59_11650 [Deltaproteobacteria bacterium HGW-Deltaproteobacteria-17]|nr:MAG: hypothetical protein CVU59_11650 [Deltaproteobacteria bacterium HGW-Deltaproteobacteria-17]
MRASAQDVHGINILNFKMSTDPSGLVTQESAQRLNHLKWYLGGMFSYAYDPLRILENGDDAGSVISHQLLMDLSFSIGIWKYFQVGVNMQAVMYQTGDDAGDMGFSGAGKLKAVALSDLRLVPKVILLQQSKFGFGLAFLPILTLPTATSDANAGDPSLVFEPRLVVDRRFGNGLFLVGNLGYRLREAKQVANLMVDDEIVVSVGAEYPILPKISLLGEIFGTIGLSDSKTDPDSGIDMEEAPFEAVIAGRWRHDSGLIVTGGLGRGLTSGYGTPGLRVFVGAGYVAPVKTAPAVGDADGDGITDDVDKCVNDPEDKNGFEDEDGCPDAARDTDKDGIPDATDKCVSEPEDKNGFEDTDGCPDADKDTDKDGIPDVSDKCPADAEDKDGVEDTDGCPDADNDGDGFCDPWVFEKNQQEKFSGQCKGLDKCPAEKEIINGVEDEDGCPDKGQEKAVITKTSIIILDKIYFQTAKATLLKASYPVLDLVVQIMKTHTHLELIEVQGHTDDVGDDDKNLTLSSDRAETVRNYLISKGIDAARITAKGYGETTPLSDCSALKGYKQETCRGKNRRVEFKILKLGKPVNN